MAYTVVVNTEDRREQQMSASPIGRWSQAVFRLSTIAGEQEHGRTIPLAALDWLGYVARIKHAGKSCADIKSQPARWQTRALVRA
jgi:hypothetical protein